MDEAASVHVTVLEKAFQNRLEGKLKDTDACFFPLANDRPVA